MKNLVIVALSVGLFLNTSFGKDIISKFTSPSSEEQKVSQVSKDDKEKPKTKKSGHKHGVKGINGKKETVKKVIDQDTNSVAENWKKVEPLNLDNTNNSKSQGFNGGDDFDTKNTTNDWSPSFGDR